MAVEQNPLDCKQVYQMRKGLTSRMAPLPKLDHTDTEAGYPLLHHPHLLHPLPSRGCYNRRSWVEHRRHHSLVHRRAWSRSLEEVPRPSSSTSRARLLRGHTWPASLYHCWRNGTHRVCRCGDRRRKISILIGPTRRCWRIHHGGHSVRQWRMTWSWQRKAAVPMFVGSIVLLLLAAVGLLWQMLFPPLTSPFLPLEQPRLHH
mmetsp:Transcript_23099/g.48712  ORF Transcript_23099/g.48712 Transcript_23099/m.48712 type:complete len:203 (+) Transcript_23099:1082-1690(+)